MAEIFKKEMTEQEKQLLLKDLCARLPYKLHCRVFRLNGDIKENDDILYGVIGDNVVTLKCDKDECLMYYQIKPYLRPMSSMTEGEAKDYFKNSEYESSECYEASANYESVTVKAACSADEACVNTNWLIAHHFDYRGLIPMGLALPATEGMYK